MAKPPARGEPDRPLTSADGEPDRPLIRVGVTAGVAISPPARLAALADKHGGVLDAEARSIVVTRIAPLDAAEAGDLSPLTSRRHVPLAARAGALLVDAALAPFVPEGRRWVHEHAAFALAGILADLVASELASRAHSDASSSRERGTVDPGAEVAEGVSIGAGALVMAGATIGAGSIIEPHAVIYPGVRIGQRVAIGAGAVIGRPGFGWATGPNGQVRRIPQLGGVFIDDDVEVGPLATIDAGTLSPTVLERGVRLDAHVHVGHNAVIGPGTFVAAQSGFAGSVRIGGGVRIGGQAGVADHVRVGDGAQIAAKAGVIGDIPSGAVVAGYPAVSRPRWLRGVARMLGAGRKKR